MTHYQPSLIDVAWAAGLFEGEGHLSCRTVGSVERGARPLVYLELGLSSTDEDVIRRFAKIIGCGRLVVRDRKAKAHHKPCWEWRLTRHRQVIQVIDTMRPYLGARRLAKADEMVREHAESRARNQHAPKPCVWCGTPFIPRHSATRDCYCTQHCANVARYTRSNRTRSERNRAERALAGR